MTTSPAPLFVGDILENLSTFQLPTIDLSNWTAYMPIALAGAIVWALWLYRVILSRRAKPIVTDFTTTTSVIVPSFHEDTEILMACLDTWRRQDPTEIIIVLDLADTEAYGRLVALGDERIKPVLFPHAGKRSALGEGMRRATGELFILTDSDTFWEPGLLAAVQMPFADPNVGGVSTQQNVYQRTTSVWRRVADWLVNLRYYDYVPAMGRAGAVACISGRTGAYRRTAALPVLENLENEFFMGRRCISGDDGRLTWLVLASGFKTVHQSSARALSMFPSSFRAFVKQRVRWSRNSYRCYLTAVYKGWLWRVPFVTKITVLQILLTPVTMGVTMGYLIFSRLELTPVAAALAFGWILLGRGIRGFSHLRRHPQEIILLPLVTAVVILIALPIKVYAFFTMNKQGWLTRHADSTGGDGQTSSSLSQSVSFPQVQEASPVAVHASTIPAPVALAAPAEAQQSPVGAR
ncbi:glycosyltransferase [Vibrio cholerae]|nr:glycosyltransferase [Vibrio cholerae]